MKFFLSNFLIGDDFSYIFKNEKRGLVEFSFIISPTEDHLCERYKVFLQQFLRKLDRYPLYIHVLDESNDISISEIAEMKKVGPGKFYHFAKIENEVELVQHFQKIYLDAFNNENVLLSSEKYVEIDPNGEVGQCRFIFDYRMNYLEERFYLWIGFDGIGWDFIANFTDYPYNELPIKNEMDL
ncbi:hypothetical protein CW357_18030 [Rummeliibacillus sp. TYF005]|uniref:hypothetical protein n=1 Tax=Rummeliibacillus sp. TYF005 TaxID=2058214 RepID=UPI000F521433|nr:hypothetical protein [Rummeliibacillus sp. TYF005]RPJ93941.1 hypothetical protein CW357_18030 [Rummeliibacillus sp. TYF005]